MTANSHQEFKKPTLEQEGHGRRDNREHEENDADAVRLRVADVRMVENHFAGEGKERGDLAQRLKNAIVTVAIRLEPRVHAVAHEADDDCHARA